MCDPIFQIGLELIRPMSPLDLDLRERAHGCIHTTERRINDRRVNVQDVLAQAHREWADRRKNTGRRIDDRSEQ